jgi:hypothetical protein
MSILKRILKGQARPAVMRPVPLVPLAQHPARSQSVETLELRVREALPPRPAFGDPDVGADATPRGLLMSADRVRHMGDCKVAQLERELVMERMRVKELREKLVAVKGVLRDMGEQYESIGEDLVCVWVEETVFPDLTAAVEGGGL